MISRNYVYNMTYWLLIFSALFFSCKNSTTPPDLSMNGTSGKNVADTSTNDSIKGGITLQYIMGKFNPDTSVLFMEIPISMADREGLLLRKEAYNAFRQMWEAAKKDGIHLVVRSATRNFTYQKGIWERKWTGQTKVAGMDLSQAIQDPYKRAQKILNYSSMPGTSRHHWGTEVDLNAFENEWFERGEGLKIYNWLLENAPKYGFYQPYSDKSVHGRTGYNEEKWHWSYKPLSSKFTAFAEAYMKDGMILGFKGDKIVDSLNIVENYVLGVSEKCLNK